MLLFLRSLLIGLVFCSALCFSQGNSEPSSTPAVPEEKYREVAGKYRCPTCTGLSVLESDAPFSVQIQTRVRKMLAEGKSDQEIETFFLSKYGPWILRSPPKKGFGLMAWLLPLFFLVVGLGFLLVVLLQKGSKSLPSASSSRVDPADILQEFDKLVKNPGADS
jgi:cytochrome c-type biogenesis protein CcmH/NrfF